MTTVVAVVVVALLVAGGGYWLWSSQRGHSQQAVLGDCLQVSSGNADAPYRVLDCTDAAARYKVVSTVPVSSDAKKCREVAGASRSVTTQKGTLCLAKKDVDPAKAVNTARQGDCVTMSGGDAQRVECGDRQARFTILKRLQDVADFQLTHACDAVDGAVQQYEWAWDSESQASNAPKLMFDLVLCLGDLPRSGSSDDEPSDSSRGDSSRGDSSRGDSSQGDSSRSDSSRGDRAKSSSRSDG